MTPIVHILATCTNPELLPSTLLVFDSLRVGFPTAEVVVYGNGLPRARLAAVEAACVGAGGRFAGNFRRRWVHGVWIENCLQAADSRQTQVFLDTDVVFWQSVEGWQFLTGLAGRYLRRYRCPYTGCVTEPRLHPSLLFVDRLRLAEELRTFGLGFRETRFNPLVPLWRAMTVPRRDRHGVVSCLHDTASLLYQAVGGTAFTPEQLDHYDHLFAGTYVEDLSQATGVDLLGQHQSVWASSARLRGAWRHQNEYFARHAC